VDREVESKRNRRCNGRITYGADAGDEAKRQQQEQVRAGGDGHQHGAERRREHHQAEHALAAEPLRQPAGRHLRQYVAPVERVQDRILGGLRPRELAALKSSPNNSDKLCGRPPQYAPAPCKLTFDLENGVRVTCDVAYLYANFSLPTSLFLT